MTSHASILTNFSWLSGAQFAGRLLQLAAYASLARRLGEIGFGRFAYAFSLLDMVAFLATLGLPILYTRHVAAGRHAAADAAVVIKHRLTLVVALAGGLWLFIAPPSLAQDLLVMMFLAMLLRGYHHFGASGLRGKEQMRGEAIANVVGRLVFAAGAGGGVWLVDDLSAMLRLTFVAFLLAEMVTLVLISRAMQTLDLGWSPRMPSQPQRQELWKEMLPFAAAGLMGLIAFRVDLVMLRELSEPLYADQRAGAYGAAYRILEAGLFVPGAVAAALFPALVRRTADQGLPTGIFRRALLIQLGLGFAGALVLYFGAELWVRILAGPGFDQAVPALAALGLAVPFLFVNFVLGTGVFALGKEWWGFLGLTLSLLLNIIGNYWVITRHPEQALVGAAIFTAASEAVLTLSHLTILALTTRSSE